MGLLRALSVAFSCFFSLCSSRLPWLCMVLCVFDGGLRLLTHLDWSDTRVSAESCCCSEGEDDVVKAAV